MNAERATQVTHSPFHFLSLMWNHVPLCGSTILILTSVFSFLCPCLDLPVSRAEHCRWVSSPSFLPLPRGPCCSSTAHMGGGIPIPFFSFRMTDSDSVYPLSPFGSRGRGFDGSIRLERLCTPHRPFLAIQTHTCVRVQGSNHAYHPFEMATKAIMRAMYTPTRSLARAAATRNGKVRIGWEMTCRTGHEKGRHEMLTDECARVHWKWIRWPWKPDMWSDTCHGAG